jgi:hypothetical protein
VESGGECGVVAHGPGGTYQDPCRRCGASYLPAKFLERKQSQFTHFRSFSSNYFKMASEKKVAENMLWGGRFTRK